MLNNVFSKDRQRQLWCKPKITKKSLINLENNKWNEDNYVDDKEEVKKTEWFKIMPRKNAYYDDEERRQK